MNQRKQLSLAFLCMLLISTAVLLQQTTVKIAATIINDDDIFYLPGNKWLKFFSMGYNEALSDLLWVKCIIYFATAPKEEVKEGEFLKAPSNTIDKKDDNEKRGPVNYTLNYVKAVTSLDPRFKDAYDHGARLTIYHRGRISKETVQMAIDILEEGIARFPTDGQLRFNLGFLYYYEMMPFLKSEEKKEYKQRGAQLVNEASRMDNAPTYTVELASTLLSREGMNELVVEHLKHSLLKETDPNIREVLESQLKEAVQDVMSSDIQQIDELYGQWRQHSAYVPFDLFTLLYSSPPQQNESMN